MNKLIKLELVKNKLTSCIISLVIINILMTAFLYMIATIATTENDINFCNYDNILRLHTGVVFFIFTVTSIIVYSKFIIEDYTQERGLLMFSYPVSRTKLFICKLILVNGFIISGLLLSTLIPNILFFITENIFPILGGNITLKTISAQFINILNTILVITSIGFISLRVSFITKSIHTTIVTTLILSVIGGNILIGLPGNLYKTISFMIFFIIGTVFAFSTNKAIKRMEV